MGQMFIFEFQKDITQCNTSRRLHPADTVDVKDTKHEAPGEIMRGCELIREGQRTAALVLMQPFLL